MEDFIIYNYIIDKEIKKNNFQRVINFVTSGICFSLGLLLFLRMIRLFDYSELLNGYLQVSLLIFILLMVIAFLVIRKFDIDFDKTTAVLLIVAMFTVDITAVVLFFFSIPALMYICIGALALINILIFVKSKLQLKTKFIILGVNVLSVLLINSGDCNTFKCIP